MCGVLEERARASPRPREPADFLEHVRGQTAKSFELTSFRAFCEVDAVDDDGR